MLMFIVCGCMLLFCMVNCIYSMYLFVFVLGMMCSFGVICICIS